MVETRHDINVEDVTRISIAKRMPTVISTVFMTRKTGTVAIPVAERAIAATTSCGICEKCITSQKKKLKARYGGDSRSTTVDPNC
jgi:formate dehydrogenase assembly factor FdhD